jgi:hypothetical protein
VKCSRIFVKSSAPSEFLCFNAFLFWFKAIFISKLAVGGTAELDKRLRVGDKVLSVSEVIRACIFHPCD